MANVAPQAEYETGGKQEAVRVESRDQQQHRDDGQCGRQRDHRAGAEPVSEGADHDAAEQADQDRHRHHEGLLEGAETQVVHDAYGEGAIRFHAQKVSEKPTVANGDVDPLLGRPRPACRRRNRRRRPRGLAARRRGRLPGADGDALLGMVQTEVAMADSVKLDADVRHAAWEQQLTAAGAGLDDPVKRLEFIRWQVLRAGTPLRLMAQNQEVGPIPLAAAHTVTGLLGVIAASQDAVATGDVETLAAQAEQLHAAREALVTAIGNTDILLHMLKSVGP